MKRITGAIVITLFLTGCSILPVRTPHSSTEDLLNKLAEATSALAKGDKHKAFLLLGEITTRSSVDGVTDEALFQLALLQLSEEEDSTSHEETRLLLTRLHKYYPRSRWTALSQPLLDLLDEMDELESENQRLSNRTNTKERRELQSIKGLNQSLIKQNKDLQQTIERLKAMDLELERKSR